jgi:hypothetical protein
MIDTQLLNQALAALGFTVGLAILIAVAIVVAAGLHQRHERQTHVREIEQHLATVADERDSAPVR